MVTFHRNTLVSFVGICTQGLKWGNTAIINQYPVEAKGIVQFKDGRYRIVLRNIKSDYTAADLGHNPWDSMFTKKHGKEMATGKAKLKILDVFAIDFISYFTYHLVSEAEDW